MIGLVTNSLKVFTVMNEMTLKNVNDLKEV